MVVEDPDLGGIEAPRGELYQHHRDLVAAVIHQAISDLESRSPHSLRPKDIRVWETDRKRASDWLMSDNPRVFGFVWCCIVIDQEPGQMRAAIFGVRVVRPLREMDAAWYATKGF